MHCGYLGPIGCGCIKEVTTIHTQVATKAGSTVSDFSFNFTVREGVDFYARQNYLAIQELELKVQGEGVIAGFQSFSMLAERGVHNLR